MTMKKCMGCMRDYGETNVKCPVCGYSDEQMRINKETLPEALEPTTIIGGRYILGRTLSCSDFSIVYVGWDALLEKRVAVKEYFPYRLGHRKNGNEISFASANDQVVFEKGMEHFENEIRTLTKHQDIHEIVEVYRCVRENNTSYMIMEYMAGCTLEDWLEGDVSIEDLSANDIFGKLLTAIDKIHTRKIGHYNLAPDSVYLDEEGNVRLLDFGYAKKECLKFMDSRLVLMDGRYSAPEVMLGRRADENADLYSLGAICYRMLTGDAPGESIRRLKKKSRFTLRGEGKENEKMINLLAEVLPEKRPGSIRQFREITERKGESPDAGQK